MQFEALTSGFYIEALALDDEAIWFSDVAQGGVRRLTPDGEIKVWLPERLLIGGLQLNDDGCVLASGPDGIAWFDPASGASGMLLSEIDGARIRGINEMTPDGTGGMYFGTIDLDAVVKGQKPGPSSLYRLSVDGQLTKLVSGLTFSNGVGFSLDRAKFYHNESFNGTHVYDVAADGSLSGGRKLLDNPDCDGLAVDAEGGVWISGFSTGALTRLAPNGDAQKIDHPGDAATNVRFRGDDGRDMIVNCVSREAAAALEKGKMPDKMTSVMYRARSDIPGRKVEKTRFRLR